MSLAILRFLALTIGPSITAAARPATTFFVVQLVVAALVYHDIVMLPVLMAWLVSAPAIIVAAMLAGLETAAQHDSDVSAILQDMHVDTFTGAFSAFTIALMLAAVGLPEAEAVFLTEAAGTSDSRGILEATTIAIASEHGYLVSITAVLAALAINLGLTWLRSRFLVFIRDFKIGQFWAWIETGGVLGILVLLPFLPLVTFAFLLVFLLILSGMALAIRGAAYALDQRSRVPCAECDYAVRVEASICPSCKAAREPSPIRSRFERRSPFRKRSK